MIKKLDEILLKAQQKQKRKLAVACPYDVHTLQAVDNARKRGMITAALFGNTEKISQAAKIANVDLNNFEIVSISDDDDALAMAVKSVSNGDAYFLMKGLISSEKYLKAVLKRNGGLIAGSTAITHVAVMENPNYHKLIIFGDSAILPQPDLKQKLIILNALTAMSHILENPMPKVAVLAATELISNAIIAGPDAAVISKMSDRRQLGNCIAEGPLSLDLAINAETAEIKGVRNDVTGDADCLIFPDIEAGNSFYKANTKLAGAQVAGCLAGTKSPVVLTSRGDSAESKLYSIALAMVAESVIKN